MCSKEKCEGKKTQIFKNVDQISNFKMKFEIFAHAEKNQETIFTKKKFFRKCFNVRKDKFYID
jgi:hypothetical protein